MLNSMLHGAGMVFSDAKRRKENTFGNETLPENLKELRDENILDSEDARKLLDYLSQSLFHFSQQEVIYSTDEIKYILPHSFNDVKYWIIDDNKKVGSVINFKAFSIKDNIAHPAMTIDEHGMHHVKPYYETYYLFSQPLVRFKPFNWFTKIDKSAYEPQNSLEVYPIPYSHSFDQMGDRRRTNLKYMIKKIEGKPMEEGLECLLSGDNYGKGLFNALNIKSRITPISNRENNRLAFVQISEIKKK